MQAGTWTCFFIANNLPEDYLTVIKLVSHKYLEDGSEDMNSVAKFNFRTLQDSLLYVFDVFNEILYKVGGPREYGHDYRHQHVAVPRMKRVFPLPQTYRL